MTFKEPKYGLYDPNGFRTVTFESDDGKYCVITLPFGVRHCGDHTFMSMDDYNDYARVTGEAWEEYEKQKPKITNERGH